MKITPYGSITPTSSQVSLLYGYYINSDDYNPFYDYVICRNSEYEYTLYYGSGLAYNKDAKYIQYYRTGSTSNYIWKFRTGNVTNFSVDTTTYTSVGTVPQTIQYMQYENYRDTSVTMIMIIALFISFFVLKIRGNYNVVHRFHH